MKGTEMAKRLTSDQALRTKLRQVVNYPPPGHPRRTRDGYPCEIAYDQYAYERMVDSFREAINEALGESAEPQAVADAQRHRTPRKDKQ